MWRKDAMNVKDFSLFEFVCLMFNDGSEHLTAFSRSNLQIWMGISLCAVLCQCNLLQYKHARFYGGGAQLHHKNIDFKPFSGRNWRMDTMDRTFQNVEADFAPKGLSGNARRHVATYLTCRNLFKGEETT